MTVREWIVELSRENPDAEVLLGGSDTESGKYFVWRRDPRIVEPPKKLRAQIGGAVFIEGLGEVVATGGKDKKRQALEEMEVEEVRLQLDPALPDPVLPEAMRIFDMPPPPRWRVQGRA